MKIFPAVLLSFSAMLSTCGKTSTSSFAQDKTSDAKLKKLAKAKTQFLLEKERKQSLATALAIVDLERQMNGKLDKEAFATTLVGANLRKATDELRSNLGSTTAALLVLNASLGGSRVLSHQDPRTLTPGDLRLAGQLHRGLMGSSVLGVSSYFASFVAGTQSNIKLSEKQKSELSLQFKNAIPSEEFKIVCDFLDLVSEDRRELEAMYRKAALEFFEYDYWRTVEDLTFRTFFIEFDKKVNFVAVAKKFEPLVDAEDYKSRVLSLEEFFAALEVANKLGDERNTEFKADDTIKDRLEILVAYEACLEDGLKGKYGEKLQRRFLIAQEMVAKQISILKELAELEGSRK